MQYQRLYITLRNMTTALPLLLLLFFGLSSLSAYAAPLKIVVLGDSLVAGYQLPAGSGFIGKMQAALDREKANVELIGAGVSGDTTSGGLSRLDWSVAIGTHAVFLELGANDALRGISPKIPRKNLTAIVEKLKSRNIAIFLVGMRAPPNMGEDYQRQFDRIYPDLATAYNLPLYPFFLDGVAANPKLNLGDGMHPNEKGIDVIVAKMLPSLLEFIKNL